MGFERHLAGVRYDSGDAVEALLMREYGAVFAARNVTPPTAVVFRDQAEVAAFQAEVETAQDVIGGFSVELQARAMAGLQDAVATAAADGLSISPRGADSAKRSYEETIELWLSRVEPALEHWTANGRLTEDEATALRGLGVYDQVREVLRLERDGIYFAKDLSKSIIYSVAPPGTSQHLAMLAFDVAEFNDARVRQILGEHGWFQTVTSDLPHFTYLGVKEEDLPGLGLKKLMNGGRIFWVPRI